MDRRSALILAGTAALVVVAGATALAANLGILGVADADTTRTGSLDATTVSSMLEAGVLDGQSVVVADQTDGSAIVEDEGYDEANDAEYYSGSGDGHDGDDHEADDHDSDKNDKKDKKDDHDKDKHDRKDHDDDDD